MVIRGDAQPPRRIVFTDDARFAVAPPVANKPTTVIGYPILWNVLSTDRGGYKVRLLPGSATFTTPTLALYHHDFQSVIGTTDNTTLRLTPDDIGVKCEIDLPNTSTGRDVAELIAKRYVRGMSFAMVSTPRGVKTVENGETILDVEAFAADEITITPIPAFQQTDVGVKTDPEFAATRIAHAHQLERFKLDRFRFAGTSPRAV